MGTKVQGISFKDEGLAYFQDIADKEFGGNLSLCVNTLAYLGDQARKADKAEVARIAGGGTQIDMEALKDGRKAVDEARKPEEAREACNA